VTTATDAKGSPARLKDQPLDLRRLLTDLVGDGIISKDQPASLLVKLGSGGDKRHPLVAIADMGWSYAQEPQRKLTLDALTQWLAGKSGVPYYRIDPLSIELHKVTQVMSYAYAARLGVLPVKATPTEVTIATAEPYVEAWQRELEPILKRRVKLVMSSPVDIQRYLVEFYALAKSIKASEAERTRSPVGNVQNLEQLTELGRAGKLDANDQHVVAVVDWLLQYAFDQRASDIHIEPRRETGNIRFRIDGVLHDVYQLPATVMMAVTSRIKILARMDVSERRRPLDGRIKTRSPQGREIELRVSSLPTAFGEKIVMRIFDPEVLVKDFAALGFAEEEVKKWDAMIREPNGIILVTGPTGSGKTTTLYSTLKALATSEVNVCTIEDPIELVAPEFNQMQVQPAIDLGFAEGVRALLRQDPDIIMVGEIRDLETAEIAVQAALTGHLVLSTLHTNDAPSAITRLLDLGAPAYLLRATLLGVMAQRLLRKLCPHCKQPRPLEAGEWKQHVHDWKLENPGQVFEAKGCLECRETGYLGRVGIYEFMPFTPALKALSFGDVDLAKFRRVAIDEGMTPLRLAGMRKVAEGLTTIEEAIAAAPDPLRDL
jgi:general secretion pathway protein E